MRTSLATTFALTALLAFAACDEAKTPKQEPDATKADEATPEQSPPKAPALQAKAGEGAKKIVATLGHPDQDFGGAKGEACFGYDDQADKSYCFTLKTAKASWAEVFGENYPLREIRARTEADTGQAKAIKKPVLEQQDAPE